MPPPAASQAFCAAMLPRVSRTFALGIASLPEATREPVMVSYLLCRIADAIEDELAVPLEVRRRELTAFRREVLLIASAPGGDPLGVPPELVPAGLPPPDPGPERGAALPATSEADRELLEGRDHVLALFAAAAPDVRRLVGFRVAEMASGMAELLQAKDQHPIGTHEELERYCYFVAGTVGHLLTGLFLAAGPRPPPPVAARLFELAPRFGTALQLVNIIKDVAGDLVEGRCFLPSSAWPGPLPFGRAASAEEQARLRPVVLDLIARASPFLDDAEAYLLALPPALLSARRFCAFPLHLALLTLRACGRSPHLLEASRPVKVSRAQVAEVAAWVEANAGDDRALVRRYDELRRA